MIQISNDFYEAKWSVTIKFKHKHIKMLTRDFLIVEDEQVILERIVDGVAHLMYGNYQATMSESDFKTVFKRIPGRMEQW